MTERPLRFVVLGLSITSSWGNGHATTYRSLLRALSTLGHDVLFLERDMPWYAAHRDLPEPPFCRTALYRSVAELKRRFTDDVAHADVVMLGSFVPDGVLVGRWIVATARGVTAFYDIDTPVTLERLRTGDHDYFDPDLAGQFDLYLSFTAGRYSNAFAPSSAPPPCCRFTARSTPNSIEPGMERRAAGISATWVPTARTANPGCTGC